MSAADRRKEEYKKLVEIEAELDKKIAMQDKERSLQMTLLHEYNDIKDAAQVVIAAIANTEGTTVRDIHQRLGLAD